MKKAFAHHQKNLLENMDERTKQFQVNNDGKWALGYNISLGILPTEIDNPIKSLTNDNSHSFTLFIVEGQISIYHISYVSKESIQFKNWLSFRESECFFFYRRMSIDKW